jgi:CheY-like chemotaxis protein
MAKKKMTTILVVDDEPAVREVAVATLSGQGFHILSTGEPARALDLVAEGRIDLLVTDVVMPKMNGFDLAARAQRAKPALKVLYLSGYAKEMATRMAAPAPILMKPYRLNDLIAAVENCLAA